MNNPSFDVVIYGATGFTGRQAATYLARHHHRPRFRFAIAGRSESRLRELAEELEPDGVLVADAFDREAIDRLVSQTRVVATTVGPYSRYGDDLVRSCVERGVHYADITGETPWVRTLIDRFHDQAKGHRARIVNFCGYDSVPSDLGTLWSVERLREASGQSCRRVRAFHRARGGINGGTVASMLYLQKQGRIRELEDPLLLNPPGQRSVEQARRNRDPEWPYFDLDLRAWAAPFFMGPINTRVVRRSHALLTEQDCGYGPGFSYQEYWLAPGPLGGLEAGSLAGMWTFGRAFRRVFGNAPSLARLMATLAPAPGTGPSDAVMDRGFFRCDLVATGSEGAKVRTRVSGRGDPGNRVTVKCLCESALALALDGDFLPDLAGGILTPATAIGSALVARLERSGIDFSVQSSGT